MRLGEADLDVARLAAPLPVWHGRIDARGWSALAETVVREGGRLVALWGRAGAGPGASAAARADASVVSAAYALGAQGLVWVDLEADSEDRYPDLAARFPCANRMQRAIADLCGLHAAGAADERPWLDHGAWAGRQPLRGEPKPRAGTGPRDGGDYAFVRVEGDGVHEIPVGPVHAGIIEPGHFRFSVVGEKVLRLEERLGYVHKGIERRFTELDPLGDAHRLAGRVSGDSTVAFAWAYCMALESALAVEVPERAAWLRALMLERERIANHLGDLGALGNDAALAIGLAHFSRLREDWQRASAQAFGHRFMMDAVLPGGVAVDIGAEQIVRLHKQCDAVERELADLRAIYDSHAGLQDRFIGTGRVDTELARRLGLTGLAGRASGIAADLRHDHPWPPYDRLQVRPAQSAQGDVAARVAVRFDEIVESLRLIRTLLTGMPAGAVRAEVPAPGRAWPESARGAGWIEGWRGEVLVALELRGRRILRCHCHDPSWQNWPVLEHAVIGNIVPDFPLINKSFNLSYSGQDL
ncbi:MAG: NADH-quinone oxidoreductase subunit C [Rubrivivax sp.]